MPVTWSDEKLILLYCPDRGSNSRPSAHRSFKHGRLVPTGCKNPQENFKSIMNNTTVNLGTMTDKSREVANMLKRRKVSIECVQETKCKGAKAREIGGPYKMYYAGKSGKITA